MEEKYDIDKIVRYLNKYKSAIEKLYTWNANIDRLLDLEILSKKEIEKINNMSAFHKEIELKKTIGKKLKELKDKTSFNNLCLWIIKDWGKITTGKDVETIQLIEAFLKDEKPQFKRIASSSKVGAYLNPQTNIIYDSRVAYALNWIILSENAGKFFFPIPEGRNSKMLAFDMKVLIRLKNISLYKTENIEELDHKFFIKNVDKKIFINEAEAYFQITKLIKEINQKLWEGDKERVQNLYYTEMLLFSIADREVFSEITNSVNL